MKLSTRYKFFVYWIAFTIGFHLIISSMYVSCAVFPVLMVNHSLGTNPFRSPFFEKSVTCRFFFGNCSHLLTRTQEKNNKWVNYPQGFMLV